MNARRRISSRKGFPENLYCKADGYFWYRNPRNGKTKGLGRDRADAFRQARLANAELDKIAETSLIDWVTNKPQLSFKDWLVEYEPIWIKREKPAANTLRIGRMYIAELKETKWAWMPLREITSQIISDHLDSLDGVRGTSTIINIRSRISDAFRTAETKGLIPNGSNPVLVTYTPEYEPTRDRLTLDAFLAIREKAVPWLKNAMNLALTTGQRREDIANMLFSDVVDGYLLVAQRKGGGRTKLKINTSIRLDKFGMSIDEAIRLCRDSVLSKHMVHHVRTRGMNKPGDPATPQGITDAFRAARKFAGISPGTDKTPVTFHEIRSLAERLYKEQHNGDFVQALLGHKEAKTTAIYDDLRGTGYLEVSVK